MNEKIKQLASLVTQLNATREKIAALIPRDSDCIEECNCKGIETFKMKLPDEDTEEFCMSCGGSVRWRYTVYTSKNCFCMKNERSGKITQTTESPTTVRQWLFESRMIRSNHTLKYSENADRYIGQKKKSPFPIPDEHVDIN